MVALYLHDILKLTFWGHTRPLYQDDWINGPCVAPKCQHQYVVQVKTDPLYPTFCVLAFIIVVTYNAHNSFTSGGCAV